MSKKLAIIGSVGVPANYGGFETLVEYLSKHISHLAFCDKTERSEKLVVATPGFIKKTKKLLYHHIKNRR